MKCPVIVLGGGGHAKVLIDVLKLTGCTLLGFTDLRFGNGPILGVAQIGNDHAILRYTPEEIRLVNGIGSIGSTNLRRKLYEDFKHHNYHFATVIHPEAVIAADVDLNEGAQVMAGAIIQPGCIIGSNTVINTRVSIDHDCKIGQHVHVAPGAVLSGGVHVNEGVHIGVGATIIQGIKLGRNSVVGAGAVVTRSVPDGVIVVGVPAKEVQR